MNNWKATTKKSTLNFTAYDIHKIDVLKKYYNIAETPALLRHFIDDAYADLPHKCKNCGSTYDFDRKDDWIGA